MERLLKFQLRLTLNYLLVLLIALPAQAADRITYYHNDALGSPVAATSQTGQLLWRESYRPYGERLTVAPASANNHTWFTGKQEESALGISYFGARWYLPSAGRFLSRDPAPATAENIHSFNRYAYANNNPYKFVDPNGRDAACIYGAGCGFSTQNIQANISNVAGGLETLDLEIFTPLGPIGILEHATIIPIIAGMKGLSSEVAKEANVGTDFFTGTKYTDKVLGQMKQGDFHAFPESVTGFQDAGQVSKLTGGDGTVRDMLRIPGEYRGKEGAFEFIKEPDSTINHRVFRPD